MLRQRFIAIVALTVAVSASSVFIAEAAAIGVPQNKAAAAGKNKNSHRYATQIAELHAVKELLESANHDYKGHRAAAVKEISQAIHVLRHAEHPNAGTAHKTGKNPGNNPKHTPGAKKPPVREPQALSDDQLQGAAKALQAVHGQLASDKGPAAATAASSVQAAIGEIKTALTIK